MIAVFPELVGEMAKRGITKSSVARELGISTRALYSKLVGSTDFTLTEASVIQSSFFPDMGKDALFARADPEARAEQDSAQGRM